MTLAVKVALNPITTNQEFAHLQGAYCTEMLRYQAQYLQFGQNLPLSQGTT